MLLNENKWIVKGFISKNKYSYILVGALNAKFQGKLSKFGLIATQDKYFTLNIKHKKLNIDDSILQEQDV